MIWFYDPHDKQFTYTSAKNKFQNTALNNSDLIPQRLSQDYKIKNFSEVNLGKFKCIYYELTALSNNVDYPTVKLWVSKDDGLIRKKEDYLDENSVIYYLQLAVNLMWSVIFFTLKLSF